MSIDLNGIDIPIEAIWNLNAKLIIGDSRGYLFIKTDTLDSYLF